MTAPDTRRLAFVITNAQYQALGALRNPIADGRLVSAALRTAGFEVKTLENLSDDEFRTALKDIARSSETAGVTLVYYAGHGAQIGGVNYLIPVDLTEPQREEDVRLSSVSADDVLSVMKSPYKVLILDACRDNPVLSRSLSRGRGMSFKRGLARISPADDAEGGVFIAYSTQADAVAEDGSGAHSAFAESFAKYVGSSVSIDDMFAMVTRDVLTQTKGQQRPFKYASLDTVFCLPGTCGAKAPTAPPTAAPPPASTPNDPNSVAEEFHRVFATRDPAAREQWEQALWQQLKNMLPEQVAYGFEAKLPDGSFKIYGFYPKSARSDTRTAFVTAVGGQLKDHAYKFNSATGDLLFDCAAKTAATTAFRDGDNIKFFSQAEQKANAVAFAPDSPDASIAGLLCTSPLRLTPLWAVDRLPWTDIGDGFSAALTIRYQPLSTTDIWYLFSRSRLSTPNDVGGTSIYRWIGINCRTHRVESEQLFDVDAEGRIVWVNGRPGPWKTLDEGSAGWNAHVVLCGHSPKEAPADDASKPAAPAGQKKIAP